MPTRSGGSVHRDAAVDDAARAGAEGRTADAAAEGPWLTLGKDGRLTAFARTRGGLLRWTQTRSGGTQWTGPVLLPAKDLTHVSVVQGADAYVHFLGRRVVRRKGSDAPVVDLVHAVQYQTGRPMSEWRSLGNPHADPQRAADIGPPAGVVSASGRVHVFVRNAGGGLMLRREDPSGKWERWADLKGSMLQDRFAVVPLASGRLEVLAGGSNLAMRWLQDEPDGAFQQDRNIPVSLAAGTVSGIETAPGRVTYYWVDPGTGGIVAHRPGGWLLPLGGTPTGEPVTVLRAPIDGYDCTVLAHRGPDGQVMLAACGTENEQAGVWWSPTGEHCVGAPALAQDGFGRVVLATVGTDGAVRVARQADEGGLVMAPAVPV